MKVFDAAQTVTQKEVNDHFETRRRVFITRAEQEGLREDIANFIQKQDAAYGFNHWRYINELGIDVLEFAVAAFTKHDINLNIFHHGNGYYHDYQDHKDNTELRTLKYRISEKICMISKEQSLPAPPNLADAIAQQKLLTRIPTALLSEEHYREFTAIKEQATNRTQALSHNTTLLHLDNIHKEIQQCSDRQNANIARVGELVEMNKKNIDASTHAQHQLLESLQKLGIDITPKLDALLANSAVTQDAVKALCEWADNFDKQRDDQAKLAKETADYQGQLDACQFLESVGALTGCKGLSIAANAVGNLITINRSFNLLSAATTFGTNLLSPMSAIGMATINIFMLFSKQQQFDPNVLLFQQLRAIMHRLEVMHRSNLAHFENLDRKISALYGCVLLGFRELEHQQKIPILRKLDDVEKELLVMRTLTHTGFHEVLLKDLVSLCSWVNDVRDGIKSLSTKNAELIEEKLSELRDYVRQGCASNMMNGLVYQQLLDPEHDDAILLAQLFQPKNSDSLMGVLGLLALYARNHFPTHCQFALSCDNFIHPEIWYHALSTYIALKNTTDNLHEYDKQEINIGRAQQQAQAMLNSMRGLVDNRALYTAVLSDYQEKASLIASCIARHSQSETAAIAMQPLSTLLERIEYTHAQDPQYQLPNIPEPWQSTHSSQATALFVQAKLYPLLDEKGIKVPPIFLLAEKLKLGYFKYEFVFPPANLCHKKHHTSDGQQGKYSIHANKESAQTGFSISFVLHTGKTYTLYKPSPLKSTLQSGYLTNLCEHLIADNTKKVITDTEIDEMNREVTQAVIEKRKGHLQRLMNLLLDLPEYHNYLRHFSFLSACLTLRGHSEQQRIEMLLPLHHIDMVKVYKSYIRSNPIALENLPSRFELPSSDITNTLQGIFKIPLTESKSLVFSYLQAGLSQIQNYLLSHSYVLLQENGEVLHAPESAWHQYQHGGIGSANTVFY